MITIPKAQIAFRSINTLVLCCSLLVASHFCILSATASDYAAPVSLALKEAGKLYDSGHYASAKMQFYEALRMEPNCPDAYNGLGLCAAKEGRMAESVECYKKALQLKPDFYNSLYNLANNYYIQNNYSEAISFYSQALDASKGKGDDPKATADLLSSLATVYRARSRTLQGDPQQQDIKRALNFYHKALERYPDHPQAHAMLGSMYADGKQYSAAERELRTAISIQPKYSYAYYVLGQLYLMKKEAPAALVAFQNSLKFENVAAYKAETAAAIKSMGIPSNQVDHFALGYEMLHAGKWDSAATEFEAAAATPSEIKAVALNNLAYARYRAGDFDSAQSSFERAIAEKPHGQPEFYYNLGEVYLRAGSLDKAQKAFQNCIAEAHGNHYLAHNALGVVLKARGDAKKSAAADLYKEALGHFSLALMQSGDALTVVQFNRALLLEQIGRIDEAIESYTKYIQSAPSGLNVAAAKEKLAHLKPH